jgi:hypothetical protein
MKVAKIVYDFAKDGGAVGNIIVGAGMIPKDAIVVGGLIFVNTAVTSGGAATVALRLEADADLLAATAKASISLNAKLDVIPVRTAATVIKATDYRGVTVQVAVADLTAGKLTIFLEYYQV